MIKVLGLLSPLADGEAIGDCSEGAVIEAGDTNVVMEFENSEDSILDVAYDFVGDIAVMSLFGSHELSPVVDAKDIDACRFDDDMAVDGETDVIRVVGILMSVEIVVGDNDIAVKPEDSELMLSKGDGLDK